jgi:hypothetical protein
VATDVLDRRIRLSPDAENDSVRPVGSAGKPGEDDGDPGGRQARRRQEEA